MDPKRLTRRCPRGCSSCRSGDSWWSSRHRDTEACRISQRQFSSRRRSGGAWRRSRRRCTAARSPQMCCTSNRRRLCVCIRARVCRGLVHFSLSSQRCNLTTGHSVRSIFDPIHKQQATADALVHGPSLRTVHGLRTVHHYCAGKLVPHKAVPDGPAQDTKAQAAGLQLESRTSAQAVSEAPAAAQSQPCQEPVSTLPVAPGRRSASRRENPAPAQEVRIALSQCALCGIVRYPAAAIASERTHRVS